MVEEYDCVDTEANLGRQFEKSMELWTIVIFVVRTVVLIGFAVAQIHTVVFYTVVVQAPVDAIDTTEISLHHEVPDELTLSKSCMILMLVLCFFRGPRAL